MSKLIYLYNNFHLNKISILFMVLSSIFIIVIINNFIDIDLENITDLRNYDSIKKIYINDVYIITDMIFSIFVIILSFMDLYNNAILFDFGF